MIIHAGTHQWDTEDPDTWPLGLMFRADGSAIQVFRDTIVSAYAEAVGAPPLPPNMQGVGKLQPTYTVVQYTNSSGTYSVPLVTGYVFDQGMSDLNNAVVAEYKATCDAWAAHAQVQSSIVQVYIERSKAFHQIASRRL